MSATVLMNASSVIYDGTKRIEKEVFLNQQSISSDNDVGYQSSTIPNPNEVNIVKNKSVVRNSGNNTKTEIH